MTETDDILTLREPEGGPSGRGTVVVVAGRGERAEVYRRLGTRLAFDAYRTHVISDATADPERARRLVAELAAGTEVAAPLVLVGSDTGALFAAALAAEDAVPGLAGLILAGLPVIEGARASEGWDAELAARTSCPTHRGRISESIVTPGALYEAIPDGWSARAAFDGISVPVLAVHGQLDPVSPLAEAREALGAMPELELVTVAGAPHDALNDQTHRTVAATIVLWLERLRRDAGMDPIAVVDEVGAAHV